MVSLKLLSPKISKIINVIKDNPINIEDKRRRIKDFLLSLAFNILALSWLC